MCDGTRLFKHSGYHNPEDPYKWKSCPYCDHEGTQLIEAAESTMAEYLKQLDEDDFKRIMAMVRTKDD
jgi:hypothetical protein|tara:strand:- start:3568 stop:3771 length:204 start_codon:yes stop_codon:yes gene_type:complete